MAKRAGSILLIAATPLFLLALTLLALARPKPVLAATLTVGIDCATLQACITAAAAGDQIEVPAGTYTVHATINKALTIHGAGPAATILDGGNSGRVLDIPIAVPVTLANLTIQNGSTSGHGGGVYAGASLTLQNVVVRQNQAANAGGLWVEGALTITDSQISQNQCTDTDCAGGGIYVRDTTVITDTDILSNTAAMGGGMLATAPVTLQNVLLQNNLGGGLNGAATLLLIDSQVISNTAPDGGGLRNGGNTVILNSELRENSCTDNGCRGGALHALSTATISNSLVISNAGGVGGGVWANGVIQVTGGSFSGNQCLAAGCIGGAIYSNNTLTTMGTTFSG
ncbi:MAG: hypothetical protein KDE59_27300, partial [Anaerolineales bacterium]|nr:hypothetical protein [Anaerolineales bacterium]